MTRARLRPISMTSLGVVLVTLALCATGCDDDSADDEDCFMTCGCQASDPSGTCTGPMEATLTCGTGSLTCDDVRTDRYGTITFMGCDYDNGRHFSCNATLDQIGRVRSFHCGGEGASCDWPGE